MKAILKLFSEHGTFIQPDALQYISSKETPDEFAEFIIKNLKEYPLILTIDQIKIIEQNIDEEEDVISTQITEENEQDNKNPVKEQRTERNKEIQTRILSQIYLNTHQRRENEDEYEDESDIDDQNNHEESTWSTSVKTIEIKKIKTWKPVAREYEPEVKILKDITGKSTCEGTTQDFAKLFKNRYTVLKKILQSQRRETTNTIPINRIKKNNTDEVHLIGIVKNTKTTSNGHRLIELEDETGTVNLIALKNNPEVLHTANEVINDEVIGVKGRLSKNKDLIIIQSIVFPDISIQHTKQKADVPVYAAFLSDLHIGSKMFMEEQWHAFLKWINGNLGNTRQRDVAGRIKYIIVPGDIVDGIGIYPNQEKELAIRDIYRQYEELAKQFQYIPDHITIIMQPGNHDAVRPAEPQPAFEKEIQDLFQGKNIIFAGNPCYFSLHGVEVLSYHGQSLLDYATNIQHLKYNEPIEIMRMMLKKRHLAPVYGGYTPLAPEHLDYMIIDKVPDIFVTGHVHISAIDDYRGVTLINASSWQAQTMYQQMLNFIPDSAKLPIVDLKTGNATTMDFSQHQSYSV